MVQGFSLLSVSTNLRSLRAVLHRFGSEALGSSAPPLNRSVRHQVADTGLPVPVRSMEGLGSIVEATLLCVGVLLALFQGSACLYGKYFVLAPERIERSSSSSSRAVVGFE